MVLSRRGFIQSFMGAAAMAAVPGDRVVREGDFIPGKDLARMVDPSGEVGFGLAPAKAEGSTVAYDPFERSIPKGVLTQARVANMKAFGLDPENPEHVEAYLEGV